MFYKNMYGKIHQNNSSGCPLHDRSTIFLTSFFAISSFLFFFIFLIFYFFFSTVQPGDPVTHTYIHYFFSHYMFYHKWLDKVPSATQQEPIANPSPRQESASINPRLPIHPTPSPSPLATTSLLSMSMIFFSVERFLCAVYYIPDISHIF